MATMTDVQMAEVAAKARQATALDALSDADRLTYSKILGGLKKLEDRLPAECTPENEELIGKIIKGGKGAEKMAAETFQSVVKDWDEKIKAQRGLWKPLGERAKAIVARAVALVDVLLQKKEQARIDAERSAREAVAKNQQIQADAEAKALAAQTPEEVAAATKAADVAWNETRKAVAELASGPAQTAVKVGGATVFNSSRLDFEITDMGAFAKAHPELVEVLRGKTLAALRDATKDLTELPQTLAGWPGITLKMTKKPGSR